MTWPVARRAVLIALLAGFVAWDTPHVIAEFLTPRAGSVDFRIYYAAAQALVHGRPLYLQPPPCCFNVAAMSGYTYPPVLAFLTVPLTALPVDVAGRVWMALEYAALLLTFVLGVRAASRRLPLELIGWLGLAFLTSGAIGAAIYGIQATPVVVGLEAVFAWCVIRNRLPVLGGLCLALAVCLKVSPLLLAPAVLLLPRDAALRVTAGFAAGIAAASALTAGVVQQSIFYAGHVLPSFSSGVVAPWNRSLPGVVLRTVDATGARPSPVLGVVFIAMELAGLAITWIACRGARPGARTALTIAGLLAVTPIVQGVTWDHHLVVELLVLLLLAPWLRLPSRGAALAAAGIVLTGVNQQVVDGWLSSHALEPPHGAGQVGLFIAQASINLAGMVALWLAVVLTARVRSMP